MDVNDLMALEVGEFVEYIGPAENRSGLEIGQTYEVVNVDLTRDRFQIRKKDGFTIYVFFGSFEREWDLASFVRLGAVAQLQETDYPTLIDCALDTKDFEWFKELHAKAFPEKELSFYF